MTTQKKNYRVSVTKTLRIEFDLAKLDDQFWNEFNSSIDDRGGPDVDYLAEHVAWNYVQGDTLFVEGIGDLKEMGVRVIEDTNDVEIEG